MELTILDWGVIVIVGLSALLALFRGFIREVFSLATWLLAVVITLKFYEQAQVLLEPHISHKLAATGLAIFGTFFSALLVLTIISSMIVRFLHAGNEFSVINGLMGMLFGVLRGTFIIAISYLMIAVVIPKDDPPEWMANAVTLPYVEKSAEMLTKIAPTYVARLGEMSQEAKEKGEELNEAKQKLDALEQLQGQQKDTRPKTYDKQELERLLKTLEREKTGRER